MARRRTLDSLPTDPERYRHGTRARYVAGCKCDACRAANRAYANHRAAEQKAGRGNPLVSAAEARAYMQDMSRLGIGRRAFRAACGVGDTTLQQIRNGGKTRIRRQTAERILAVGIEARAPHALVPAALTQHRIQVLLSEGWTKTRLAKVLGSQAKMPALQLRQTYILRRHADAVQDIYRRHQAMKGGAH